MSWEGSTLLSIEFVLREAFDYSSQVIVAEEAHGGMSHSAGHCNVDGVAQMNEGGSNEESHNSREEDRYKREESEARLV